MRRALLLVLFVAAACGGPAKPASAPAPAYTCADAVAGLAAAGDRGGEQLGPEVLATVEAACVEDAWPADAIACFATGPAQATPPRCDLALGPELEGKLLDRLAAPRGEGAPKKLEYEFSDDVIEGDLVKPDGEVIIPRGRGEDRVTGDACDGGE
jgi:hypothetical protein